MRERDHGAKASIYQSTESFRSLPTVWFGLNAPEITMTRIDVCIDGKYEREIHVSNVFLFLAIFTGIQLPHPRFKKRLERKLASARKYAEGHAKDVVVLANAA